MNGKQLSDCLDSACSWPDTPPVVAFAKEAWQCVSRQGEGDGNGDGDGDETVLLALMNHTLQSICSHSTSHLVVDVLLCRAEG